MYDMLFWSGVCNIELFDEEADKSIVHNRWILFYMYVCMYVDDLLVPLCVHSCLLGRIGYGLKFGFSWLSYIYIHTYAVVCIMWLYVGLTSVVVNAVFWE